MPWSALRADKVHNKLSVFIIKFRNKINMTKTAISYKIVRDADILRWFQKVTEMKKKIYDSGEILEGISKFI